MSKLYNTLNKKLQSFKLAQNKNITRLGLRAFTHYKNVKNVLVKKNISYGKNKLQKFDVIYPKVDNKNICPVVFYVHGGSWCGGDKYGYTSYCKSLSSYGYIVVNINYRLMPKVSVRTCVADCILAMKYFNNNCSNILQNSNLQTAFNNVFMIGDSAGAHLVSLISAKITCDKLKLPFNVKALGLYYGVYNFENISYDPSPIMVNMDAFWKSIYCDTKKLYKEISTTTYVTDKFPPTFMTSGEIDKLHFQSEVLYRLLKYNKVEVEYLSFNKKRQDARHAFLNAPFLDSAKEAFRMLVEFFDKHKLNKQIKN